MPSESSPAKLRKGESMKQELISVEQASEITGFCGQTIRNYLRSGKIKGFKVNRDWRVINKDEWWLDLNNGHKKGD